MEKKITVSRDVNQKSPSGRKNNDDAKEQYRIKGDLVIKRLTYQMKT